MTAKDLKVGDVIRVPGYPGVKLPARMDIISNDDYEQILFEVGELDATIITLSFAQSKFDQYTEFKPEFQGSFWAIERDGKQIYPQVTS